MAERCWAFLAADFELAARRALEAVGRLQQIAATAAETPSDGCISQPQRDSLEALPEWVEAQRAIAAQLTALAALEDAGLAVPTDALEISNRAKADFERLSTDRSAFLRYVHRLDDRS